MENKAKTINDIVVENGIAILNDVLLVDDIKLLHDFAVENNIEKYVAIKTANERVPKRFALVNGVNTVIGENEFGINEKYVAPTEECAESENVVEVEEVNDSKDKQEELVEVLCESKEDKVDSIVKDSTDCNTEIVAEQPVEHEDISVEVNAELTNRIVELELALDNATIENAKKDEKIAELNIAIAEVSSELETLKATAPVEPILVNHEIELADVVEFLKKHGLKSIVVE